MIYNSFLFLPPTHPHQPSHHKPKTNNLNPLASTHDIPNHRSQPTTQPTTKPTQPTHSHHPSHHKPTTTSLNPQHNPQHNPRHNQSRHHRDLSSNPTTHRHWETPPRQKQARQNKQNPLATETHQIRPTKPTKSNPWKHRVTSPTKSEPWTVEPQSTNHNWRTKAWEKEKRGNFAERRERHGLERKKLIN